MSLFATFVLAYYFFRQWVFVIQAHREGHSLVWTANQNGTIRERAIAEPTTVWS